MHFSAQAGRLSLPACDEKGERGQHRAESRRRCEKIGCHAERSEASAFISLRTDRCRFLAALGMTGLVDFFTTSEAFLEARQRSRSKDWG